MSANAPVFEAILTSWPAAPGLWAALSVSAVIYAIGWRQLRRRDPSRWRPARLLSYLAGLSAIALALASPIETFSGLLLQVHMVQHLLLMMAAPPLLWLGEPLFPMLRGLPTPIRRYWVAPILRSQSIRRFFATLTHPVCALIVFVMTAWVWHAPVLYDLALRSDAWHYAQHASFLTAGLLFWYPVIRPYPGRPRWPRWLLFPYLILADVQNTVLAALFTFADRVIYPHYAQMPRLGGQSALDDQAIAGVIMWVPGSLAFLVPLALLGTRSLFAGESRMKRIALPLAGAEPLDVLRWPVIGRLLRAQITRRAMQALLFLLAGLLIYDGLTGTQAAPLNLAGVVPWIHWRGVLILALLVAGNVFCMACPFMLPRAVARRLLPQGFAWPRFLRNKWLAVALLVTFLWSYEAFALWDSPWLTAWIAMGYFGGALVVDGLFRGAAFCKYVCPIGQFNFVQSLVSPLEVRVRDRTVCTECQTKDCIRGRPAEHVRGCELSLYLPRKAGNLDCTMCLDCVRTCPHDNIGIQATLPAAELWRDPPRSGIGRFSRRPDIAALVLVLVFGAFANASGMVAPVVDALAKFERSSGLSALAAVTVFYVLAIVVLPLGLVTATAILSRILGRLTPSTFHIGVLFAYSLVPLGFAMWLSHYSFHLVTSYEAVVPALNDFATRHDWNWFGSAFAACDCCRPVADWLLHLEILALDFGLLLSLYASHRIALSMTGDRWRAFRAHLPWAVLTVALFALGIWILLQPMQMRGTLP